MKVVILAGGLGTRLREETETKPKPMVEIGGMPVLWHIMKLYAAQGFHEFVVALGYKGEVVKDFFLNYRNRSSNLRVNLGTGAVECGNEGAEPWTVDLVDTGLSTMTGGRIKRVLPVIGDNPFLLTYGDGVANVDLWALIRRHQELRCAVTVTAVRPPARFGAIKFNGDLVEGFEEKPQIGEGWINGGFFVVDPQVGDYIQGDETYWEREPLATLANEGRLGAYRHGGFWQCMDTVRDVKYLNELWDSGKAPWKNWGSSVSGGRQETAIHQFKDPVDDTGVNTKNV